MSEQSAENDAVLWCSEHMEPYCPRHSAENDVRLVRQEHLWGCGVATLAMVTGQTYDEVRSWILDHWGSHLTGHAEPPAEWLSEHGVTGPVLDWYLAQNGYVWRRVYSGWKPDPWPPEPFAPVHVAQVVQPSGNAHFVVLAADGRVLDPMSDKPRSLTEWEKVNFVQGVWTCPIPPGSPAATEATS